MPKQRMTTADVVSEVACIRKTCLGMRVANIYDLDSKVAVWARRDMPHMRINISSTR